MNILLYQVLSTLKSGILQNTVEILMGDWLRIRRCKIIMYWNH